MPMARAVTLGWNSTPPASTGVLTAEPQTQKVNRLAVLPQKLLYAPESTNAADTSTVFLLDDNNRFNGGAKFGDGNQFIYFAVGHTKKGRPAAVFDEVAVEKIQPELDEYCKVNLTKSAYDKVMASSMASEPKKLKSK